jgi:hypothetical protein
LYTPRDRSEFRQRCIDLDTQNAAAGIQDPIISRSDLVKLRPAQSETLSQQTLRPVSHHGIADRLFCRGYPGTVNAVDPGQNENGHKTALKSQTLIVNAKKLGAFSQPSLLWRPKA